MSIIDHVFVINLKHRTDRRETVEAELVKAGIDEYEIFEAVCPSEKDVPTMFLPRLPANQRCGAWGCLMSHRRIIEISKEREYERVLVFEDDVAFSKDLSIASDAMDQLDPIGWDVLFLSGNHQGQVCQKVTLNTVRVRKTFTTHSYVINKSIFDVILHGLTGWNQQVDVYFASLQHKHKFYCVIPHITYQLPGYSDIVHCNVDYRKRELIEPKIKQ